MPAMASRSYVFLLHQRNFPHPFLVEMSRLTLLTGRQLAFYEPNVVCCPPCMGKILRETLHDRHIFQKHRAVIKATVLSYIKKKEGVEHQEEELQEEIVTAIICDKLSLLFTRNSRGNENLKKKIQQKVAELRHSRLEKEAHLGYSFRQDILRSMNELNFVLQMKENVRRL